MVDAFAGVELAEAFIDFLAKVQHGHDVRDRDMVR
jgi:hypothetical protein